VQWITIALTVILPAGKIPHEIPEVHIAHLVSEKIPKILSEGRTDNNLLVGTRTYGIPATLDLSPVSVGFLMIRLRTVHPRENGHELLIVFVFRPVIRLVFSIHLIVTGNYPFYIHNRSTVIMPVKLGRPSVLFHIYIVGK